MAIYKVFSNKDNTLTNAFKADLRNRGTQANMGASDVLEVFSIFAAQSTSSLEQSRVIIDFPIDKIKAAATSGLIPAASSDRKFKLKLYNAKHSTTVPNDFVISVHPIQKDWTEGSGLDMENYSDLDASNWISASFGNAWASPGADFNHTIDHTMSFTTGLEDLEIDVSSTVEQWLSWIDNNANGFQPFGFLVKMSGSAEDGSSLKSYYTKRFFGKDTEFFFKRPTIEVQFDDSTQDSSALPDPYAQADKYILSISNLKSSYKNYETPRLKVHSRNKKWQPNIYTKATATAPLDLISEMYYKITRIADNLEVIPYSTGSVPAFSKVSYNSSGSFFDLRMANLEPNYMYEISFVRKDGSKYIEIEDKFKFRIEK